MKRYSLEHCNSETRNSLITHSIQGIGFKMWILCTREYCETAEKLSVSLLVNRDDETCLLPREVGTQLSSCHCFINGEEKSAKAECTGYSSVLSIWEMHPKC